MPSEISAFCGVNEANLSASSTLAKTTVNAWMHTGFAYFFFC